VTKRIEHTPQKLFPDGDAQLDPTSADSCSWEDTLRILKEGEREEVSTKGYYLTRYL
jgi:hypothetical protein